MYNDCINAIYSRFLSYRLLQWVLLVRTKPEKWRTFLQHTHFHQLNVLSNSVWKRYIPTHNGLSEIGRQLRIGYTEIISCHSFNQHCFCNS